MEERPSHAMSPEDAARLVSHLEAWMQSRETAKGLRGAAEKWVREGGTHDNAGVFLQQAETVSAEGNRLLIEALCKLL